MTTAQVGYEPVYRWVKPILGRTHTTVVVTVVWAVLCLLVAQRATPAALARALPAAHSIEFSGDGPSSLPVVLKCLGLPPCCLENFSRRGRGHRFEMHSIPQMLDPPGQPIHGIVPPPGVKIVRP